MIYLNDEKYLTKDQLSEDKLMKYISDYDIFKHYIPDVRIGKQMLSPLRNEKDPSFGIFYSKKYKIVMFKDLGSGERGGGVHFVQLLYGLSYQDTLVKIVSDFMLENEFSLPSSYTHNGEKPVIHTDKQIESLIKESINIQVTVRDWNGSDTAWWNSYGIQLSTLRRFRVYPLKYVFINDYVMSCDPLCYAYLEYKDNECRYKIYQPKSLKMKWINNFVDGTLSGFSQLPENGELLIIASSLKDAMTLFEAGFSNVISPQTEGYIFNEHVLNDLKARFKRIILFYDHDKAGLKASEKMKELFGLDYVTTGIEKYKDPSDYRKYLGKDKFYELLRGLFGELFNN